MSLDVVGYVIGGLFALAAVVYTTRSTARAKREQDANEKRAKEAQAAVEKVRADGEAYERAQRINKQITDGLQDEVQRLQDALLQLRLQLKAEETRSEELDVKVDALQRSVNRMTALLLEHNIPVPVWGVG